jgi:hypothetical protein
MVLFAPLWQRRDPPDATKETSHSVISSSFGSVCVYRSFRDNAVLFSDYLLSPSCYLSLAKSAVSTQQYCAELGINWEISVLVASIWRFFVKVDSDRLNLSPILSHQRTLS